MRKTEKEIVEDEKRCSWRFQKFELEASSSSSQTFVCMKREKYLLRLLQSWNFLNTILLFWTFCFRHSLINCLIMLWFFLRRNNDNDTWANMLLLWLFVEIERFRCHDSCLFYSQFLRELNIEVVSIHLDQLLHYGQQRLGTYLKCLGPLIDSSCHLLWLYFHTAFWWGLNGTYLT